MVTLVGRIGHRFYVVLFAFVLLVSTLPVDAATQDVSPWLSGPPTVTDKADLAAGQPVPITLNPNQDCQKQKIITRPAIGVAPEQSKISCLVDTGYGAYGSADQLLQRQGTTISGLTHNSNGGQPTLIAIPRSSDALILGGSTSYGSYVYFAPNLDAYLSTVVYSVDGSVKNFMSASTPFMPITDKSGQRLSLVYDSISFSANGNWMIAEVPFVGFVRINLSTREILPFSDPSDFRVAVNPNYRTAISPDGRYAFVSTAFDRFSIYDLSTCAAVPSYITSKVTCESKSFLSLVQQNIPGFSGIAKARFRGNFSLELYASYTQNNVTRTTHAYLTAAGKEVPGFEYLGMGDSFASGEGVYGYKALSDTPDNMCHLSLRSYPYLISQQLSLGGYESVACSGAKIKDVVGDAETYYMEDPQAKGKIGDNETAKILENYEPGYRRQITFLGYLNPGVITISAVGNDIGFGKIISRCVSIGTCYGSYEERLEKIREIDSKFSSLADMYSQLVSASAPTTKIYAIGYPRVANPDGNCEINVGLSREELRFANDLVDYLNGMIERAAKKAGVFYVDVSSALGEHKLCDNSASIAMNGITGGRDMKLIKQLDFTKLPIANESYHPNEYGHGLLATSILEKTSNFTAPMPPAQPDLQQPSVTAGVAVLDNVPKSNRAVRQLHTYDEMGNDMGARGQQWQGNTSKAIKLQPGSTANVEIRSTPVQLGSFTVGSDGRLGFAVTLPGQIEPGFHTMHIMGKNLAGEAVDLEKVIYVTSSDSDLDGDGLLNEADPCPTVSQSGQDIDKDGIDDACDDVIGPTPPPVVPVIPVEPPIVPLPEADAPPAEDDETELPIDPQPPEVLQGSGEKELPVRESDPWASYLGAPAVSTLATQSSNTTPAEVTVISAATTRNSPLLSAEDTREVAALTPPTNEVLSETDVIPTQPENPLPMKAVSNGSLAIKIILGILLSAGILGIWVSFRKR